MIKLKLSSEPRMYVRGFVLFVALLVSCSAFAQAQTKPNIILILIDDMGWRDLGCYGSSFYETPNIDRLAKQGMRFTDAYAACPVCSPTRAAIMTGQYPSRVGITDFIGGNNHGKLSPPGYLDHLPLEQVTIAEALKEGGYQTWHLGKWHLGGKGYWPNDQGFDVNVGGYHAGHPVSYFSPYKNPNLKDGPKGEFLTDRLTTEAIKLIEHRDPNKPFFMNFWHYAVHIPLQAPKALVEKYREKAKRMGISDETALIEGEEMPTVEKRGKHVVRRVVQGNPVYAALIENLDTNVGRLMDALEKNNLAQNTIVIFSSDNGGLATAEGSPTSNLPLEDGKGWMYEGGIREPFIVRWPGVVKEGSTSDGIVTSPDFYPTFLEAAGLPLRPKQHVDGVSFMPLLKGTGASQHDAIYWDYPHYGNQGGTPTSAIRAGDWKLIEFYEDNHFELYNLKDDLEEKHDLAKANPDKAKELLEKLENWRKEVGAKPPTKNPDWK